MTRRTELGFWFLVGVSSLLYLIGNPRFPIGGWLILRTVNVLKFWQTVLLVAIGI
jgi:hypothetical protein